MMRLRQGIGRLLSLCVVVGTSLFAASCGGGSGGGGGGGAGTLNVFLADAPEPGISRVEVDIARVEAHKDGQWTILTETPQTYNLLDLAQTEAQLVSTPVPAGSYNQVRLLVTACRVTDEDGTWDCNIPSGIQTGIKVNLNYDVPAGDVVGILLDFNVHKSLHKLGNGNYQLQPVIPAVVQVLSGTASGTATDGTNPLAGAEVKAIYKAGTAYPLDTEVNVTMSAGDGTFKLWALLPGTYEFQLSWTDPNDANNVLSAVVGPIEVAANQGSDLGSITLAPPPPPPGN